MKLLDWFRPRRKQRQRASYQAAVTNRLLEDWIATAMPADDELRWTIERMRSRGRDLARNNPYVRQYLNLLAVNVVGPHGITLQAQVRNADGRLNKPFNDKIEAAWKDWSRAPTVEGKLTLTRLSQQSIKGCASEGEAFIRMHRGWPNLYGFALERLDPDLLDTEHNVARGRAGQPAIRMGIEVDDFGRPLAYHFWDSPLGAGLDPMRVRRRVPADEVLHLYDPERAHQSRGAPWFASVMVALREVDTYQETAVVAARIGAAQSQWFTRKADADGEGVQGDEENKIAMDVEPGQIAFAPEGYDVTAVSPTYPHTDYAQFIKAELRRIASGLGVSYNALCNDLEGVNYSSLRGGLLIERDLWRSLQQWWIDSFLERVYREWLSMALLTGALVLDTRDFRRFLGVSWNPRGWAWVDPLKDTDAGIRGIQTGLASRRKLLAEQGLDLEDVLEDLKYEQELADEYGVEIGGPEAAAAPAPARETTTEDEGEPAAANGNGVRRLAALFNRGKR